MPGDMSPVLELAVGGVCRCEEEYGEESKLRGAEGDGGNMHEYEEADCGGMDWTPDENTEREL